MSALVPDLPNAACRTPGAAAAFDRGHSTAKAAKYCDHCWDRAECLIWGLENETSGIWGGHNAAGLAALRKQFDIVRAGAS